VKAKSGKGEHAVRGRSGVATRVERVVDVREGRYIVLPQVVLLRLSSSNLLTHFKRAD
jgi:hypothetical protein